MIMNQIADCPHPEGPLKDKYIADLMKQLMDSGDIQEPEGTQSVCDEEVGDGDAAPAALHVGELDELPDLESESDTDYDDDDMSYNVRAIQKAIKGRKKGTSEIRGDRVAEDDFHQARIAEMQSWSDTRALRTAAGMVITVDQEEYAQHIQPIPLLGLADGERNRYTLITWRCRALRRVVRSTMAGETTALGDRWTWGTAGRSHRRRCGH